MNNTKTIILIILLSIIVFFLTMFLVFTLKNGISFNKFMTNFGVQEEKVIFEKKYENKTIKNININNEFADIEIKENSNDEFYVKIYGDDNDKYFVDVNEDSLNIEYKNEKKTSFLNYSNYKRQIEVYIPKKYSDKFNIKSDSGDCKIDDFENAYLDLNLSSGDVEVKTINNANIKLSYGDISIDKIKDANIKVDCGDIDIEEISNKIKLKADSGDIKIKKATLKEDSEIKIDFGDIKIEEVNDIKIDADVSVGDKNIKESNDKSEITLTVKVDCGDLKIK